MRHLLDKDSWICIWVHICYILSIHKKHHTILHISCCFETSFMIGCDPLSTQLWGPSTHPWAHSFSWVALVNPKHFDLEAGFVRSRQTRILLVWWTLATSNWLRQPRRLVYKLPSWNTCSSLTVRYFRKKCYFKTRLTSADQLLNWVKNSRIDVTTSRPQLTWWTRLCLQNHWWIGDVDITA